MRRVLLVLFLGIFLNGCLMGGDAPGGEFLTELTCQQVAANATGTLTCIPTENGLLLQTQTSQILLRMEYAHLIFDSTLYLWRENDMLLIAPLDGIASVYSNDEGRVVSAGMRVELRIVDETLRTIGGVSDPVEAQSAVFAALPISNLPRGLNTASGQSLQLPSQTQTQTQSSTTAALTPIATATLNPNVIQPVQLGATATLTPSSDSVACSPPPDWTRVYTVQAGDTLTRISQEYDIAITDLVANNCLENPDQLALGQELHLPGTTGQTLVPPVTGTEATPNSANNATLVAERDVIVAGDCVALTWDAQNAQSAMLDDTPVPISGVQALCPEATKMYQLRVTHNDGQQVVYTVLVTVTQ